MGTIHKQALSYVPEALELATEILFLHCFNNGNNLSLSEKQFVS